MDELISDPTKPVVGLVPDLPLVSGKAISSRNALKHGSCADTTLILKSEKIEDFQALENLWFNEYKPATDFEKHLVQDALLADWLHQRAVRNVTETEAELMDINPSPLHWTADQHRALALLLRYQTTRANNVNRARKTLESYRQDRSRELQVIEKSAIGKQRLAVYTEKNKPEPSIHDLIQKMMAKKAEKDRLLKEAQA